MLSLSIKKRFIPLSLTIIVFCFLTLCLLVFLELLNHFPVKEKIQILVQPLDIIVGMTIYIKTSIDFALFMGNLMAYNPGWKKRIAIEIGTALGNGLGTLIVLTIWFFFKQAPILMALMIFIAALVLLDMAEEGLKEFQITNDELQIMNKNKLHKQIQSSYSILFTVINKLSLMLRKINSLFEPVLSKLLPQLTRTSKSLPFFQLLLFSLTVPFFLGLDDFAGYIPLFSIINVFSFIIGVFFAHMLLNIGLFSFPKVTTRVTQYPLVVLLGSFVFIGLAFFGFWDIIQIFTTQILK